MRVCGASQRRIPAVVELAVRDVQMPYKLLLPTTQTIISPTLTFRQPYLPATSRGSQNDERGGTQLTLQISA